jgi:PEP-CTERM motif
MRRLLPLLFLLFSLPTYAGVVFSTGTPDGRMAMGSMPVGPAGQEIEAADDFLLTSPANLTGAKFYGIIPAGVPLSDISQVVVEFYRVFPIDSTNPPSGNVPTRTNSPSDVAFQTLDSAASQLTFTATILGAFTTGNSVLNNISVHSGGEGPESGIEVEFDVNFASGLALSAGHYFFVPQVQLLSGNFFWLSAAKPITGGTGPFFPDLQTWMRNSALEPDWLRVGTDIVGGATPPTFNGAFELDGNVVPEPSSMLLLGTGISALIARLRKK